MNSLAENQNSVEEIPELSDYLLRLDSLYHNDFDEIVQTIVDINSILKENNFSQTEIDNFFQELIEKERQRKIVRLKVFIVASNMCSSSWAVLKSKV